MDIRDMKPGRELDVLVANRVMGRNDEFEMLATRRGVMDDTCGREIKGGYKERTPYYSTDIRAAWEVVEKMYLMICPQSLGAPENMKYLCTYAEGPFNKEIEVFSETAPYAICITALLAMEDKA